MDRIEMCAEIAIRRALGFASLAIGTTMIGLIFDPLVALKAGAAMIAIVAAILAYKGYTAITRSYRDTELWLLLDRRHGLPEERAQSVIGAILRRHYWRYARAAAYTSGGLWGLSLIIMLAQPIV